MKFNNHLDGSLYYEKLEHILNKSNDMYILLLEVATVDHLQHICLMVVIVSHDVLTVFCQRVESIRFYKH